jgi:mannose-6-phosphate isomerase
VKRGDTMFLPSGRVHAIGAGLVIFEIQQNSDTTYRVFDWNRTGLDNQPRELHVPQSLASIDFNDFEPSLVQSDFSGAGLVKIRPLVNDPLFTVEQWKMPAGTTAAAHPNQMQIIGVLEGKLRVRAGQTQIDLLPGEFCLIPASLTQTSLQAESPTTLLRVEAA